jgi:hypothetical protein
MLCLLHGETEGWVDETLRNDCSAAQSWTTAAGIPSASTPRWRRSPRTNSTAGADADEDALLQLAIALLTERRSWRTVIEHYRTLAAYLQDEYGDQDGYGDYDEWELRRSALGEITLDVYRGQRFENRLSRPGVVGIDAVDLDDISRAEEAALCNEYGISIHDRDQQRPEQLQSIKKEGASALARDDERSPDAELDDYQAPEEQTQESTGDSTAESTATDDDAASARSVASEDGPADSDTSEDDETASVEDEPEDDAAPGDEGDAVTDSSGEELDPDAQAEPSADTDAQPTSVDDSTVADDSSQSEAAETAEDTTGETADDSPQPATLDALSTTFRELDVDRAEAVAAAYPTVEAVLAATPKELLEHDSITETCVTRLTETISWTVHTLVAAQLGREVPECDSDQSDASSSASDSAQADARDGGTGAGEESVLADGGRVPVDPNCFSHTRTETADEWLKSLAFAWN